MELTGAGASAAPGPPAAGSGPILSAAGVVKRFGDRAAIDGVSLSATAGEVIAVIGPNGAGKTTLLSLLAGVLEPDAGEITAPPHAGVGWVPQQPAVYSRLSVAENLLLFARLERVADPPAAVARMLELTELEPRAGDELGRLSGGNRQRVNIAVGLLADPAVLLLDEPSSALDPRQRERLWEFVARLREAGTTVVFSTHAVEEAQHHAERVVVLTAGRLLFDGTPAAMRSQAGAGATTGFQSAFLELLRAHGA